MATAIPSASKPEPAVTRTDTGYILKDVPGAEDSVQVQLKAGKVSIYIRLPDYSTGESYSLKMANVDGQFSYRSVNEFSGYTGAGDLKIDKMLPRDGTYQVSLDYRDSWELEFVQ